MKSKNVIITGISVLALLLTFNRVWASDSRFSFGILGDSENFKYGKSNGGLQKAVKKLSKEDLEFIVSMGDMATSCKGNDSCRNKWTKWKKIVYADLPKVYSVMGNRDRSSSKADDLWQDLFDLPINGPDSFDELTYSFDNGNSHFVVLNTEKPSARIIDEDQRAWLEDNLKENQKENTFVFFHEPAWPVSSGIGKSLDANPTERDSLWSILAEHNVTAVFSGHEHIYARKKIDASVIPGVKHDIYQFTVGETDVSKAKKPKSGLVDFYNRSNNYVIVSVNGKEITVKDYKLNGKKADSFSFSK